VSVLMNRAGVRSSGRVSVLKNIMGVRASVSLKEYSGDQGECQS
jgi:hypothetical protein